jgi:hypothetical protein
MATEFFPARVGTESIMPKRSFPLSTRTHYKEAVQLTAADYQGVQGLQSYCAEPASAVAVGTMLCRHHSHCELRKVWACRKHGSSTARAACPDEEHDIHAELHYKKEDIHAEHAGRHHCEPNRSPRAQVRAMKMRLMRILTRYWSCGALTQSTAP